jgi:hypothetical protein
MHKRSFAILLLVAIVALTNAPARSNQPMSPHEWQLAVATHIQAGAVARSAYVVAAMVELRNTCYQGRIDRRIPTDPKSPGFSVQTRQYGGPMCGQIDRYCYVTRKVVGPIAAYAVVASKGDFTGIAVTRVRVKTTAPVMTPACPIAM